MRNQTVDCKTCRAFIKINSQHQKLDVKPNSIHPGEGAIDAAEACV